jgi:MFS family permease
MARFESAPATEPASALSPFRVPVFRAVWGANTISSLGALIQSVGASWLMTSIAQSADMVALVQSSVTLPLMLLSPVAGAIADNMDRRKLMLAAQIFMLVMSAALAVCAWTGLITPWLLLFFTFVIGCGGAVNSPAWQASVRDMVPRAQLPAAVALTGMGYNIARTVGPAIGGALVAAAGAAAAFTVNALTYTVLIAVLARWRPPRHPQLLPREPLGTAVGAGIRYVSMSPAIRTVLMRGFVFGMGASSIMALLPLVAKHLIRGGPLTYGALLGAFGVGAVAGAMSIARLRERWSAEALVRWASVALALATAVLGLSTQIMPTMLALALAGAAWLLAFSTFNITVQLSAPRWVCARALSLYQMSTFGGMALGSWLWGIIASHAGLGIALLGSAVVLLLCALLGRVLPLAKVEHMNLSPLRPWKEPMTALSVEPRTGPVVVTIEYRIREEDILPFLAAMSERRRIRRRDGARNWTLLRDLSDPEVWIERYHTATWAEYMHHNSRTTQEDAVTPERLRALHRGPNPPVAKRMIEQQVGSLPAGQTTGPDDWAEAMVDP